MRRFFCVSLAILGSCAVMLVATLLAQASSLSRVGVWWTTPQEVSQSGDALSIGPQMAVDDNGHIHLIWMDGPLGEGDLYYVKSTDQGDTWSDGERVDTPLESKQGSLALSSSGRIHACWRELSADDFYLRHAQRTASGWSLQPAVVVTESQISVPTIAEAAEYLHVVWSNKPSSDGPSLYHSQKLETGGTWSDATAITDTAPQSLYAKMAVDTSDDLHVVWQESTSPHEVMYVSGTVDAGQTTWFTPITITADLTPSATTPHIVVGDDRVHIVFGLYVPLQVDEQDVYYASFLISNAEGISPTLIPDSRSRISENLPTYASPSIALDGRDNVHVVWNGARGSDSWDRIYHVLSDDQGESWSQPEAISEDDGWSDGFPTIATDGTLVHVAWQQIGEGFDNDIYYAHGLPAMSRLPLVLKDYS